jgi:Sulfotransferase family
MGHYLGSSPSALNLGEFGAFYLAHHVAPSTIDVLVGFHHNEYLEDIKDRTRTFTEDLALSQGCSWYCDSAPLNLKVAGALAQALPDAVFVLMLRHYAGAILSLRQLPWFGSSWEDNARLWVELNAATSELPPERLIAVSYDALAAEPETTLSSLHAALQKHGFETSDLDSRMLTLSHAGVVGQSRPTIGYMDDGVFRFQSIPSLDVDRWSGDIHKVVWPLVKDMHQELLRRFPGGYTCPPPPAALTTHDPVAGLIPYRLEAW